MYPCGLCKPVEHVLTVLTLWQMFKEHQLDNGQRTNSERQRT